MATLVDVKNTEATTYNFHCVMCGQLIASDVWRDGIGARCWDTQPTGEPNWDSRHDCTPVVD